MNNDERPADVAERSAGDYEAESGHERRQRLRSERIRRWRKETRHPREPETDGRLTLPPPRRFAP